MLDTLRLDGSSSIQTVLPEIRRLLDVEFLLLMSPVVTANGLGLERFHFEGHPRPKAVEAIVTRYFNAFPDEYCRFYDPANPDRTERNRVVDGLAKVDRDVYERSRMYQDVHIPIGIGYHHEPRALLCDGNSLLAWFGAMHPEEFTPRQTAVLGALVETMRRRLRIERQIGSSELRLVLDHVLDRLGAPAFVIDSNARILAASRSGRARFDVEGRQLAAALRDALRGHPTSFELTPVAGLESRPCWLAIARTGSRDERVASAIATVAARWRLTPRQRQVLELVISGSPNRTIADALLVSERAIEHHITVLFDRAGVDNRSALVATVLASS